METLTAKLQVAVRENKSKDDFLQQHLVGRLKSGEEQEYVKNFLKKYEIEFPINNILSKLLEEERIIRELRERLGEKAKWKIKFRGDSIQRRLYIGYILIKLHQRFHLDIFSWIFVDHFLYPSQHWVKSQTFFCEKIIVLMFQAIFRTLFQDQFEFLQKIRQVFFNLLDYMSHTLHLSIISMISSLVEVRFSSKGEIWINCSSFYRVWVVNCLRTLRLLLISSFIFIIIILDNQSECSQAINH